jgi:putative peptidoglycan lipid II flippase
MDPAAHQGGDSLTRSAGIASAAVATSRVSGLVREMVMARLFGASQVYDAFLLGFRIPNLTRDLFAEGALSSAFVPVFTEYLARRGKQEAARLFHLTATAIVGVVGLFCLLGMIFTPQIVHAMAPGFAEVPGKFALAVTLTRIMFPFLLLVALAAQAMGTLNACNHFGIPALSSTAFNIGSVTFGLVFGFTGARWLGVSLAEAMAFGIVFGGLVQLLSQVPLLWREGFRFQPAIDFAHPGLRRVMRLMGPALLGNAAVQVNVMVNTNFASSVTDLAGHVVDGPVSWLSYAFRFMQLPIGIFGVALASATLPALSRSAALDRMDEFRATLTRSLAMIFLLTIPSSVGLAVLGGSMVGAVYEYRRFQAVDTHQTALALACYAVGLAGYAATKILVPAFYTLHDARTPMLVSIASIGVNFAVAASLVKVAGLGHAGLALSTSAVALFGAAILLVALRHRAGPIGGGALVSGAARVLLASAAMGVVCWTSSRAIHHALDSAKAAQLVDVAVSIPLGVTVFYVLARALRVPELDATADTVLAPLARLFGVQRATLR